VENLFKEGKGVTDKNYIDVVAIVNLPLEVFTTLTLLGRAHSIFNSV
jgi:hypothetical protein